jgi:hypothetical protein
VHEGGVKRDENEDARTNNTTYQRIERGKAQKNKNTSKKSGDKAMPEVNLDGKSSVAFPEGLKPKYKKVEDEIWGMNRNYVD